MVQTEEATLTHSSTYIRGHKPTPSQESNTLSEVSCTTTISSCSDKQEEVDSVEVVDGRDKGDIVKKVEVSTPRYCDTIVRNTSVDFDQIMIGTSRDSLLTLTGTDTCLDTYRRSRGSQDSVSKSVNSQASVLRGEWGKLVAGSSSARIQEGQQESVLRGEGGSLDRSQRGASKESGIR